MNIFALTCFITGVLAGFTGFFVFIKGIKQRLNQIWFIFNLSIAIWLVGLGGTMTVGDPAGALIWQKVLYIGTIFIPFLFLHFCAIFTGTKISNFFKINSLLAVFFTLSLFFGNLFVKGLKPITSFGYWPFEIGWLYYPFLLWYGANVFYGFILLRRKLKDKELDLTKRKQVSIVFYGTLIGFIFGSVNFLLDFDVTFPPFHNFFVSAYLIFTALAITKYHLFGIKVILTELLVGIFSTFLFIQIFLSNSFWQYLWNISIFIVFLFFGTLFVKSILKEIAIRQKVGEASWKVLEQGEVVSENFKKVMGDKEKLLKDWFLSDVNKELEMNSLRNRVKELEEKYEKKE